MKKVIIAFIILIGTASTTTLSAQDSHSKKSKKHHAAVTKYTCPMHPEVIRTKPGKCPKCGMKLVPIKNDKTSVKK